MSVDIDIKKQVGSFLLNIKLKTDSEKIGFLGASGSGKSMTLKCIAGVEKPDSGHIIINGLELFNSEKKINLKPQKRKVGYLFQNYALFPSMTAEQNIASCIKGHKKEKEVIVKELIHKFGLQGCEKKYPSELSGGEQQRTALARLIASKPEIILLDEAFSALDSRLKEQLQYDVMKFLEEYKLPSIIVSHDKDEIYKMTEKTAVMDNGRINSFYDTKNLFKSPQDIVSAKLTGCKNISKVRKIDSETVYAEDWGVTLKTAFDIPNECSFIGIYPHDLYMSQVSIENSLPLDIKDVINSVSSSSVICNTNRDNNYLWLTISNTEPMLYDNNFNKSIFNNRYIVLPSKKIFFLSDNINKKY